jgi:phospholipid-binding lipoprotein MlaA
MKTVSRILALPILLGCLIFPGTSLAHPSEVGLSEEVSDSSMVFDREVRTAQVIPSPSKPEESTEPEEKSEIISDPLEPVNRALFKFNDKLYFWVLKPAATGYKAVVPQGLRVSIRNFFSNLTTPVRLGNCLLQANIKGAASETGRFLLNSTFGLAGFMDPAKEEFHLEKKEEDFGQTLGVWGLGPGIYINWPILGPSSLPRDTAGFIGDLFLDPRTYIFTDPVYYVVRPFELVNDTSLRIGDYEDLKKDAIDPYVALKDIYFQYRRNKIKER